MRYRLGADSSIVASGIIASEIMASANIGHHRHLSSLHILIHSLHTFVYLRHLSTSLAAHRYLYIERPSYTVALRALPVHPCSSIAASSIVNRRFIHHCLIIPHWKRATEN